MKPSRPALSPDRLRRSPEGGAGVSGTGGGAAGSGGGGAAGSGIGAAAAGGGGGVLAFGAGGASGAGWAATIASRSGSTSVVPAARVCREERMLRSARLRARVARMKPMRSLRLEG
ncbi:MAG: hypothetical protein DWQ11_12825 [Proteobacteria bacterium]|nr:MAG: hypothetical protein DWQ11_12825 [Pseudomonadota bacterium]